jgi:hypothetical protein
MPLHFRIIADIAADTISGYDTVATFYWMVRNWMGSTSSYWLRFPAMEIRHTSDINATAFDSIEFEQFPMNMTFTTLDSASFDSTGTLDGADFFCDGGFPMQGTLDETNFPYWGGFPSTCMIQYHAHHAFYLYKMEIWDGAYHDLFRAGTDTANTDNAIISVYHNERDASGFPGDPGLPGFHLRTWYYDEIGPDKFLPYLKVNKLVQEAGAQAMYINGWAWCDDCTDENMRYYNNLFTQAHQAGVQIPVIMTEFYPYGGDSTNEPTFRTYFPIGDMYTDSSSDALYQDLSGRHDDASGNFRRYAHAKLSPQAQYDYRLWGVPQWLVDSANMPSTSWQTLPGLVDQIRETHEREPLTKHWTIIQGGGCGPLIDKDIVHSVNRDPIPGEIKLQAWLSVAIDADGIMWYWGMPTGPKNDSSDANGRQRGLFEWVGPDFNSSIGVEKTPRYDAAAEVGPEIAKATRILDGLKFVKTYASRAFERNYPDSTFAATALDTLTDRHWCGDHVRAMKAIRSYEPCSYGDTACFLSYPESYPYVQVSRFRNRHVAYLDSNVEDYWFLVVNRRALSDEWRKIELDIPVIWDGPYYVRYVLGDSTKLQPISTNRETDCHLQTITLILRPGEAELVHFTRGENGCQDASALVDGLTAILEGEDGIRLRWEEPTQSVDSLPFTPQTYYILRKFQSSSGRYDTIAFTETNTYLDTLALPELRAFYMVHACGTISQRPGGAPIEAPEKPKKEKVAPGEPSLPSSIKRSG